MRTVKQYIICSVASGILTLMLVIPATAYAIVTPQDATWNAKVQFDTAIGTAGPQGTDAYKARQERYGIATTTVVGDGNILSLIQGIINFILLFLGILAVIFVMISGWQWMTAESEEKVKEARKRLVNSVIGLIIIFAAYGIVYVVFYTINVSFMGATT